MPVVRFYGRILPEAVSITQEHPFSCTMKDTSLGLKLKAVINFRKDGFTVDCDIEQFNESDLGNLHARIHDLVHAVVDVFSFSTGCAIGITLDKVVTPNDEGLLVQQDPKLGSLCTAWHPGENFDKISQIIFSSPGVFLAMRDLIAAISSPNLSLINCARAVEGLRHMIAPEKPRAEQWTKFRRCLNFTENYIRFVSDASVLPRHGNRLVDPSIPSNDEEVRRRGWIIMNRYLEFKKRGGVAPLSILQFPLL